MVQPRSEWLHGAEPFSYTRQLVSETLFHRSNQQTNIHSVNCSDAPPRS